MPDTQTKSLFKQLESSATGTQIPMDKLISAIPWNEQGLIPVIAQDARTKEVLMLAWANEAALIATLKLSQAHYWSRSRQKIWRKGESSGHVQAIQDVSLDCDGDALLYKVLQDGPACHTERQNCFYWTLNTAGATLSQDPV